MVSTAYEFRKKKKHRGQTFLLPKLRDHNNSGNDPFLFWDNTGYALGVVKKEMKRGTPLSLFESFRARHERDLAGTDDPRIVALLAFLRSWTPARFSDSPFKEQASEALDTNIAFRLSGDERRFIHERPAARAIWDRVAAPGGHTVQCLVSGQVGPLRRLHPKFRTLTARQNAPIASFDGEAFRSYGKEQGANSPVSEQAAHAYGTALNWLLDAGSGRPTLIGDTTVVFWADARETNEASAQAAEDAWSIAFDPDRDDAPRLAAAIERIAKGRPAADIAPDLDPRTRVHVLGLFSPNAGRVGVRFWHVDRFGDLARNLYRHWEDLKIEPDPFRGRPPSTWRLIYETAAHVPKEQDGKVVWQPSKKAEPAARLGSELLTAIIAGRQYPLTLLDNVMIRIRAERGRVTGARAALVKAVINRNTRLYGGEDLPVGLDRNNTDPAYLLGRLFALYEHAEAAGNDRNSTLRDKYFAAASGTPRRVFSILSNSYTHDLAKLRKGEHAGLGVNIEKEVTDIIGHLPPDFPKAMPLEAQGRFVVGYYHQTQERFRKRGDGAGTDGKDNENASGDNQEGQE